MKLEALLNLIKSNTNILGYCNSNKLINTIKNSNTLLELRISIITLPECTLTKEHIIQEIINPITNISNISYKINPITNLIHITSNHLIKLRQVDRICALINSKFSNTYNFTIITNYNSLSEETKENYILN